MTVKNIGEIIDLYLEDVDTVAELNLTPNPRIVVTMELPHHYARTT